MRRRLATGTALLLLVLAGLWLANLGGRALVKPDEGRYAEIAREMAASGDFVTPRLNGIKYFEKPPLAYWAGALSFRLLGPGEGSARLWSALSALAAAALVAQAAGRLFGPQAAGPAGLVLLSSLMFLIVGHSDTLDMGLCFWLTLALVAFLHAQGNGARAGRWALLAWAAAAGAVLTKGLVGLVIPGATLVLHCALARDISALRRLRPLPGLALFVALVAPWFVLVSRRNPEFAWFFFIHEHWLRYTTDVHNRAEPWYYFLPIALAGALPWPLTLLAAAREGWRPAAPPAAFPAGRFALLWAAFTLAFFSLSGSKLPPYILPMYPALALVAGDYLARRGGRLPRWQLAAPLLAAAAAAVVLLGVRHSGDTPVALIDAFRPWALAACAVLGLGSLVAGRLARAGTTALALSALLAGQLLLAAHDQLNPTLSARAIAAAVKPLLRPGIAFYSVGLYDQTLDFYLDRTVTLVEFRDELDYGLQQEPGLAIDTVEQFLPRWRGGGPALAVLRPDIAERLRREAVPMVEIARDHKRVFVRTP